MAIQSKNPNTEELLKTFEEISDSELENKISKASAVFKNWKNTSFSERSTLLKKMANYLRENSVELGRLASLEMGKTLSAGKAEVEKCAMACDYYADNAEKILANEKIDGSGTENYVEFDPLGVILAVMPWNFPFWQVYRFIAPAVMAGNVGLLKHASNVPQCAEAIERAFTEVGFPVGVFQNIFINSGRVESVIRDPRIMAVTLTGSEKAGRSVAAIAGSEIKKAVLELGGSDPFIVLPDADIALAAQTATKTRMQNNVGQSCISAKRFLVHKDVVDEFSKLFIEEFKKLKVGDSLLVDTDVGPVATLQGLLDIERQVNESVSLGAKILFGGKRIGQKGYFYEPTILSNIKKGMPVYDEEVFGPVAPIIVFSTEEEMLDIANDTPYGLSSTIFSSNLDTIKRIIPKIEAGSVFVNGQVFSDPRAPFGGIKHSGYGRELSHYGIKEFVNIKNIWIK
jgi:succinate-semialdehyde dehydrogenase/glutarate-semialdehyde dehydrogenase